MANSPTSPAPSGSAPGSLPDSIAPTGPGPDQVDEKSSSEGSIMSGDQYWPVDPQVEIDLNVTDHDLVQASEYAETLSVAEIRPMMESVLKIHEHDPNFPHSVIQRIRLFLSNEEVFKYPERYGALVDEMKLEAALITVNSPYSEVRAVVDNTDDPTIPCSTIRAWFIGFIFSGLLAACNQLFSIRQPAIPVQSNVAQLCAYPLGKLMERTLPDIGVTIWGVRHSLNPGPFSKKEHMLITIIANVSWNYPYTNNIVFVQFLPMFFNQSYAGQFSYQLLLALGTHFIGYGIAGLIRRFLVYPSYCVWPASLVTVALNAAFYSDRNTPVESPFGKVFTMSKLRFFGYTFAAMFVYFWFPNYIFQALSTFSWLTWLSPNNLNLSTITGFNNGLGLNPWPTWDWNTLLFDATDPLMVPFFSTFNKFIGACIGGIIIAALWYSNVYYTAYLPINSNRLFTNTGAHYNVSKAVNDEILFNATEYSNYSFPFLSAANLVVYIFFFAVYVATIVYAYLYHRHEIALGFQNLWRSIRRLPKKQGLGYQDVHSRLMASYKEVPDLWYALILLAAIGAGIASIAIYDTSTSPAMVIYGVILCVVFVVPVGIIKAITGIEVTLNVLAEFIGGAAVNGNALAMNFFKAFGYVTCAHAIWFVNDMKLAHYVKIPPRQVFAAQILGTLFSTFVSVGLLNFQLRIPDVCTEDAEDRFTCPHINTLFTSSVLWGTVGPVRVFGSGGMYTAILAGFPIGLAVPIIVYYLNKWIQKPWMRQVHPVALFYGSLMWAPYNLSYIWPAVPIGWFSWVFLKKRYLGFWSKYNFVLSASFSAAIAVAALIMFFALQYHDISIDWWGNDIIKRGCEDDPCVLKQVAPGEYFGPRVGEF